MRQPSWHLFVLIILLGGLFGGCATQGSARGEDTGAQRVSGEPPGAGEDRVYPPPPGPVVLTDARESTPDASAPGDVNADATAAADVNADAEARAISQAELDALVKKGPSFPLSMVQVEPAREDGKFAGFRVVEIHPQAKARLAGHLQTGDVITHLNGVRVQKPDDYLNAWKLLAQVSTLRVDFLRDDAPHHALWQVQ